MGHPMRAREKSPQFQPQSSVGLLEVLSRIFPNLGKGVLGLICHRTPRVDQIALGAPGLVVMEQGWGLVAGPWPQEVLMIRV